MRASAAAAGGRTAVSEGSRVPAANPGADASPAPQSRYDDRPPIPTRAESKSNHRQTIFQIDEEGGRELPLLGSVVPGQAPEWAESPSTPPPTLEHLMVARKTSLELLTHEVSEILHQLLPDFASLAIPQLRERGNHTP